MDKQIITFSANEQNLVRIGGEYHYSSNKVSYIGAHFDLGANWDGFDSVRAVWFTDRINGISTVLDGEGNCTVPTEVLKKKDRVFVNLVGSIVSNGELTDRLTTYPAVALVVDSKAKVDSTETAPVTPSQFEQFVSIVQDAVANIKDIVSTTLNADYTLTFVYSDGTSYTTPSIRGERGPQGADGADGTDGNGIASAVLNSNYTLTLTFTDGTSYTTPSIRGAQGPKGDPGDVSQAQLDAAVSDLKSEISYSNIFISEQLSGSPLNGKYIRSDGTLGNDSGNSGYFYPVTPNTRYTLKRNGAVGYIGFGYTDGSESFSSAMLDFEVSNTANEMTITTGNSATYMYAYAPTAYKDVISLISETPRINKVESEVDYAYDTIIIPTSDMTAYDGHYLRDNGAVGDDSSNSGYYFHCEPNTKYYIVASSLVSGWGGIGCTSDTAIVATVTTFSKVVKKQYFNTLEVITDSDSNFIFFYAPTTDIGNISTYIVAFKSNEMSKVAMENARNTVSVKMERGALSAGMYDNTLGSTDVRVRSCYLLKTNNATALKFNDVGLYTHTYIVIYGYDSSYQYVNYAESLTELIDIQGITDCAYVKIMVYSADDIKELSVTFVGAEQTPTAEKNIQIDSPCEKIVFMVAPRMSTTSRLMLPYNYSPTGKPVPLVLWMDGSANFSSWNDDISDVKIPYLQYLTDEGFAVLSIFAWGNRYLTKYSDVGLAYPYPVPTNLACLTEGLRYITDRFNVDADNVHIMSKSQGGQCALFFASHPIWDFKSIGMFSPVLDYLSMPGEAMYADVRKAIADELGLSGEYLDYFRSASFVTYSDDGIAFFQENLNKIIGLNEAWTDLNGGTYTSRYEKAMDDCKKFWEEEYWTTPSKTDIYNNNDYSKMAKIPVKIWGASDDDQTPYLKMVEVVDQLCNGGTEAHIRSFARGTGGHSCADVGSNKIASVTTASGVVHTNVPTGWVENVAWMRSKMVSYLNKPSD